MNWSERRRHTSAALWFLTWLLCGFPAKSETTQKQPLSAADCIETTRLLAAQATSSSAWSSVLQQVFVSPNGERFALLLVKGDVERNGTWLEVATGMLDSLTAASDLRTAARLFTQSFGTGEGYGSSALTLAGFNIVRWLSDDEIAFFWEDAHNVRQVIAVNLRSHRTRFLTNHRSDVQRFDISNAGDLLFYADPPRDDPEVQPIDQGLVIEAADAFSVLRGHASAGTSYLDRFRSQRYLLSSNGHEPRLLSSDGKHSNHWVSFIGAFSPDRKRIVMDGTPTRVPEEWEQYRQPYVADMVRDARRNYPNDTIGRPLAQLFVYDVDRSQVTPLLNAPTVPGVTQAIWSPNGKFILVGPTFLPTGLGSDAGLTGTAFAEVDVESGDIRELPAPLRSTPGGLQRISWTANDAVELKYEDTIVALRRIDGSWRLEDRGGVPRAESRRSVDIEVREDRNTPPRVVAVDRVSKRQKLVVDLNPQLSTSLALGRVEPFTWNDRTGRSWNALLYRPVNFTAAHRYPLVIQTHGYSILPIFSLYGNDGDGLGPGGSTYAAQILAGRGIAVLQLEDKNIAGIDLTPDEPAMYMGAYESAVARLSDMGLVNPARVGLLGFSRTGWHVEYAITHSDFPYAAALVSDNMDGGYMQAALSGWHEELARDNGGPPYGVALHHWLKNAPAFNVERVRAPLRLQIESGGMVMVLSHWEMFSRLRYLKKPVELFVIPNIERGSHGLQNPGQLLASQEGAVDWFDFWLNERVDSQAKKAEQYRRWSELRRQRDELLSRSFQSNGSAH